MDFGGSLPRMAAAGATLLDSCHSLAVAGTTSAPQLSHPEGRYRCESRGAGSGAVESSPFLMLQPNGPRWAPSHTHITWQVMRGQVSTCEGSSSTRRTRRCPRSPPATPVESGGTSSSSRDPDFCSYNRYIRESDRYTSQKVRLARLLILARLLAKY